MLEVFIIPILVTIVAIIPLYVNAWRNCDQELKKKTHFFTAIIWIAFIWLFFVTRS